MEDGQEISAKQKKKRFCVDIAHPALFAEIGLELCLSNFSDQMGTTIDAVVLPSVLADGATYDSIRLPRHGVDQEWFGHSTLDDWLKAANKYSPNTERWLSFNIKMPFIGIEDMRTCDQFGDSGRSLCLSHPASKRFLLSVLDEILDRYSPSGILFVLGSWMTTSNAPGHEILSSYCFCKYCTQKIRTEAKSIAPQIPSILRTRISPLNLGLKPQPGTGVRTVVFDTRWTPDEFLAVAESEQVISLQDETIASLGPDKLREWANILLSYASARAQVNSRVLAEFTNHVRGKGSRSAVVLETPLYDWSSALDLRSLAANNTFDEYWISGLPSNYDAPDGAVLHYYMTMKGRYFVEEFFDWVDQVSRFAVVDQKRTLSLLPEYSRKCAGTLLANRGNLNAIQFSDTYSGSCAIPATPKHITQIANTIISSEPIDSSAQAELDVYLQQLLRSTGKGIINR